MSHFPWHRGEVKADNSVIRGKDIGYDIHKLIIDNQTLIIMPYFEGTLMMDYLKCFISNRLDSSYLEMIIKEVLQAICALLEELDRFYKKGLIHNDGHMDNVLYDTKNARYIDFEDVITASDAGQSFCADISQVFDNVKAINEWFKLPLLMAKDILISENALDELVNYYKKMKSSCKNFQDKGDLIKLLQDKVQKLMVIQEPNLQLRLFDKSNIASQRQNISVKQSPKCIIS